jgi:acyl carrier protein
MAPDRANVLDRIQKVTCDQLSVRQEEATEKASFENDLGADSLDQVEVIMALEDEFGIDIPDDDVMEIKTVGDARDYVCKKLEVR